MLIIHAQSYEETISVSTSSVTTLARIRDHALNFSGDVAQVDIDLWDEDGIIFSFSFLGAKEGSSFDSLLNRISEWLYTHGA